MELFDSHCHLDAADFDGDREQIIATCRTVGLVGILVPGVRAADWLRLLALTGREPLLHAALGLHPLYLPEHRAVDLELLKTLIARQQPVAIGEIGLDYYWDTATLKRFI